MILCKLYQKFGLCPSEGKPKGRTGRWIVKKLKIDSAIKELEKEHEIDI
jgi:hypothetical protein